MSLWIRCPLCRRKTEREAKRRDNVLRTARMISFVVLGVVFMFILLHAMSKFSFATSFITAAFITFFLGVFVCVAVFLPLEMKYVSRIGTVISVWYPDEEKLKKNYMACLEHDIFFRLSDGKIVKKGLSSACPKCRKALDIHVGNVVCSKCHSEIFFPRPD